jgi:hypothetical protein
MCAMGLAVMGGIASPPCWFFAHIVRSYPSGGNRATMGGFPARRCAPCGLRRPAP